MSDQEKSADATESVDTGPFERISRRSFLTRLSAAGAAVGTGQLHANAIAATPVQPSGEIGPTDVVQTDDTRTKIGRAHV